MTFSVVKCVWLFFLASMSDCTSRVQFQAGVEEVFVNSRLVFTCSTDSPVNQILWYRLAKGETHEHNTFHEFVGNTCMTQDDTGTLQCYCNSSTVYTCAINSVNVSNDGDRLRCSANLGGITTYSNSYNISILIKLSDVTLFPRPVSALSYPIYNDVSVFMCITSQSKPAASIQWFEDETNITDFAIYNYNSYVTTSVLRYTPTPLSSKTLSCKATYLYGTVFVTKTASTDLLIQYPVSMPVIATQNRNVSGTVNIRENIAVEFSCYSTGYPPPSYHWTYPGKTVTGEIVVIKFDRASHEQLIQCVATNTYYYLNGSTGTQQTTQSTSLRMNVSYHPTFTRFESQDFFFTDTDVRVVKGDSINITSKWDANPPATVFWQEQQRNSSILILTDVQHDMSLTCLAFNFILDDTGQVTKTHANTTLSVSILYGPDIRTLKYSINASRLESVHTNASIDLIEGSNLQLICTAESNPSSFYSWGAGYERAVLNISNMGRFKNATFTCIARNTMVTTLRGNVTGSSNATLRVNIMYGPSSISAKYNNITLTDQVLKVIYGWSFEISCSAKSNPPSRMSWYGPGTPLENVLFIKNITKNLSNSITCTATTTMKDSLGNSQIKSAQHTIILDILYPPTVQQIINQTVLLNTSVTVACDLTSVGNPPETHYTWLRNGTHTTAGTNASFTIHEIKLEDEGEYKCNATNIMKPIGNDVVYGVSETAFYIDVQYKATIRIFNANESENTITVDQGQPIELVCKADGDPKPWIRIINATRESELLIREEETLTTNAYINRARCEYDSGLYKCLAKNNHNKEPHEHTFDIKINCSPRPSPFSTSTHDVYGSQNDSVVFTFPIIAYPAPKTSDITWYKRYNTDWVIVSSNNTIIVNISANIMETRLMIPSVHIEDFTEYTVNVSNEFGSTAWSFTLHAHSIPDVPTDLRIVRVGKTEIGIAWVPGFHGGAEQNFTIRYKEINADNWIYVFITSSDISYTWTFEGLKPGMEHQIKMLAENSIGKSDWTSEVTGSTLEDPNSNDSASAAIGGALAGTAIGIGMVIAVIVLIRRYRNRDVNTWGPKKMQNGRSQTQEKRTYENIGMVASHKENMQSECIGLGNDLQNVHENANNSAPLQSGMHRSIDNGHCSQIKDSLFPCSIERSTETPSLYKRESFAVEQNPIYDNLCKTKKHFKIRDILTQNLRETVVQYKDDKTEVFTEFSALNAASESLHYTTDAAIKPSNTAKNRYRNMYPYDKNRVHLSLVGNDIDTNFINASFIDGYLSPRKYIAAQGPLACTIADFWRMIWEQSVEVVVMVTNLVEESKRKCFQYWPTDRNCQYGDFAIQLLSEEAYADFVVRKLQCTKNGTSKIQVVSHFHYTAWPDKDVPDTALSLKQFWYKVRNTNINTDAPWIVHCSAGVGRTGTFIALDYLYEQGVAENQINVYNAVLLLREQRINMVQTKNQYLYLHEVLCEALCQVGDVLKNKALLDNRRTIDLLNLEYKLLCQAHIPDRDESDTDGVYIKVIDGQKPENVNKNYDPCLIPDDKYRPVLNMTINIVGHNDYINAVYISTFKQRDRLILTQSTRTSSELDFLRLLHDHNVRLVVSFCDQVEPYIPGFGDTCLIGPFNATTVSESQKKNYHKSVVRFKHIAEHERFDVMIFRLTKWSEELDICNIKDIMSILTDVKEMSCERPVVLQCLDGYSRSGLFAVLWCLVERSSLDGEVALAETVRVIRRRREQVITNKAQYQFCHEFMREYVKGCLEYANT